MKIFYLSVLVLLIPMLTACKPPSSSESVGWKSPYWYWKLQQTELNSELPMPVEGVRPNQIADTWEAARSGGRKHQGIDIFAKRGTPVLSTTQGIVRKVGLDNLGGKVVWVTGPELTQHYYAHLEGYVPDLDAGDWVEVGDVVGYVGNSGNAKNTPPHLHYGIYFTSGAVNPFPYLK